MKSQKICILFLLDIKQKVVWKFSELQIFYIYQFIILYFKLFFSHFLN